MRLVVYFTLSASVASVASTAFRVKAEFKRPYVDKLIAADRRGFANKKLTNYMDSQLIGNFSVGTPARYFNMALSFVTPYSWLLDNSTYAPAYIPYTRQRYFGEKSTTFKNESKDFHGFLASGWMASDVMGIPETTLSPFTQSCGVATSVAQFFLLSLKVAPIDGVLGLAPGNGSVSFLVNVGRQLERQLVTIWTAPVNRIKINQDAQLAFGSLNETKCFATTAFFVKNLADDHWEVRINEIIVRHQQSLPSGVKNTSIAVNAPAAIDYSSTLIGGPKHIVTEIAASLKAKAYSFGLYTLPCTQRDHLSPIDIYVSGHKMTLTAWDYLFDVNFLTDGRCLLAFSDLDANDDYWVLGARMFNRYCMVLDFGKNFIGFLVSKP